MIFFQPCTQLCIIHRHHVFVHAKYSMVPYFETLQWSKQHLQIKATLFWDLIRVASIKWCFERQKFVCKTNKCFLSLQNIFDIFTS